MTNAKVQEMIKAILADRKARDWSSEATAQYLIGYLGGMIGLIIESSKHADRMRIESDLQYHIDHFKGQ